MNYHQINANQVMPPSPSLETNDVSKRIECIVKNDKTGKKVYLFASMDTKISEFMNTFKLKFYREFDIQLNEKYDIITIHDYILYRWAAPFLRYSSSDTFEDRFIIGGGTGKTLCFYIRIYKDINIDYPNIIENTIYDFQPYPQYPTTNPITMRRTIPQLLSECPICYTNNILLMHPYGCSHNVCQSCLNGWRHSCPMCRFGAATRTAT